MKHPKAKLIICIALTCALLLALALLYIGVYGATGEQQNATEVASKLEGIGTSITNLLETNESVVQDYIQQTRNDVNLTAMSLRGVVAREGDAAIRNYGNGCVIRNGPDGLFFGLFQVFHGLVAFVLDLLVIIFSGVKGDFVVNGFSVFLYKVFSVLLCLFQNVIRHRIVFH